MLELLYKAAAFTSPVDEVVAWGEDTRPLGRELWEALARSLLGNYLWPLDARKDERKITPWRRTLVKRGKEKSVA